MHDPPVDHLAPLADGWLVWREFVLRSAGLPTDHLRARAAPDAAMAVDALLAAEQAAARARLAAIEACEQSLGAEAEASALVRRALRRLRAGGVPEEQALPPLVARACASLRAADAERESAHAHAEAVLRAAAVRTREAILSRLGDPVFRGALTWQNRALLRSAAEPLLRRPPTASDDKTRQKEQLIASYLQRYCAKNDTIGFFGPMAWGALAPGSAEPISSRPGAQLISHRAAYLEHWALDALGRRLAEDPTLRPWLAPRRFPMIWLDGDTARAPFGSVTLPPSLATVLAACDGERTAVEIAEALAVTAGIDRAAVLDALTDLADRGLVIWTLEIPTVGCRGFVSLLRGQLARVGAEGARARALEAVDALERCITEVAAAAEDPASLDAALAAQDETFRRLTGIEPTRRPGEMYAGRTLCYEDCRRDVEVSLGRPLLERLAPTLALLATAQRWYSHSMGQAYTAALREVYAKCLAEASGAPVMALQFWLHARLLFPPIGGQAPDGVAGLLERYHACWAELLGLRPGARRISCSARELEPRVRAAFAAPCPGWPGARWHSPDVMVAATDLEAIRRGDYVLVLGEMHAMINTLEQELFVDGHPDPEHVIRTLTADQPSPRMGWVMSKDRAGRGMLTMLTMHPGDTALEVDHARSWRPAAQTVSIGELIVVERGSTLELCTRDLRRRWDVVVWLEGVLGGDLPLLAPAPHAPRVTIDDVVVCRESWSFDAASLTFATRSTRLERFAGARRWASEHGLPRRVFFKVSSESKPCYLDLESPLYVEIFAKLVRRGGKVSVTEMLPDLEQCWLRDAEGRGYTSEFRMVVVDPEPWRPAAAGAV